MKTLLLSLIALNACKLTLDCEAAPEWDPTMVPGLQQPAIREWRKPLWNVRVEVMMVSMPQENALAFLPDLRSPDRIESAVAQILRAIERKEATLTGYPMAYTVDDKRVVVETVAERRYPSDFEPPSTPQTFGGAPRRHLPPQYVAEDPLANAIETRNSGVCLETHSDVSPSGAWIRLAVVATRVELIGFDPYEAVKLESGKIVKADQPLFATQKTTATLILRNGQRSLLAVHKPTHPKDEIELLIVQAAATAIR